MRSCRNQNSSLRPTDFLQSLKLKLSSLSVFTNMKLVVCFPRPVDIFQEAAERLSAKVIPLFPWIIFRHERLVPSPTVCLGLCMLFTAAYRLKQPIPCLHFYLAFPHDFSFPTHRNSCCSSHLPSCPYPSSCGRRQKPRKNGSTGDNSVKIPLFFIIPSATKFIAHSEFKALQFEALAR